MTGRAKRVLVYTATLLLTPIPLMPFERGTRGFALMLVACGVALALGSFYVVRGEWPRVNRPLAATKMLAAACLTLFFGVMLALCSVAWLLSAG